MIARLAHHAGFRLHQRRGRATRTHRDRQPALQCLGHRHAITFEPCGKREQVGAAPQRFQRIARYLAGEAHAIRDAQFSSQRHQRLRMHGIAVRRPGNRQAPVEVEQPRQRAQQHVVALTRHQRADREDLATRPAGAGAARRVVGARHHHGDARTIHCKIGDESLGSLFAGDDQPIQAAEQPTLEAAQRLAIRVGEAGFQCSRMVDQADRAARRQRILHAGEGWQCQSIDQRPCRFGKPIP